MPQVLLPPESIHIECEGTADEADTIFIKSPTAIYTDFYDSGDEGFMDANGRLHLVRRKKVT